MKPPCCLPDALDDAGARLHRETGKSFKETVADCTCASASIPGGDHAAKKVRREPRTSGRSGDANLLLYGS